MDHATNATAGLGIAQFFMADPSLLNGWLQTAFFIVSIIWVCTQIINKWQGRKD